MRRARTAANNGLHKAISPGEWELIAQRLGLSHRQVEVMQAIMAGQGKPQTIARKLGIQPSSVKTHIGRLYDRLGVTTRVEAVVKVFTELLKIRGGQPPGQ